MGGASSIVWSAARSTRDLGVFVYLHVRQIPSKPLIIWWSSSLSCGSSLTSVNVLYPEPNPSSDERIVGDDAIEEVELGSLECPRREKVGVAGEGRSDIVEEREG